MPVSNLYNIFASDPVDIQASVKMVSFSTLNFPCWKFIIDATDCQYNYTDIRLYFDTELNPIEYKQSITYLENGFSQKIKQQVINERIYSFSLITDQLHYDYIQRLILYDAITITNGSVSYSIFIEEIEEKERLKQGLTHIKIKFKAPYADVEMMKTACCREAYQGAPHEDGCDNSGGLIEVGNGGICILSVSLIQSGNTLTANVVGNNAPVQFNWQYQLPNTGIWIDIPNTTNSITMLQYGNYRCNVIDGDCSTDAIFQYLDPCQMQVSLVFDDPVLTAFVTNGCISPTFLWKYKSTLSGPYSTLPDTGSTITPTQSGYYKVEASCSGCTKEDTIEVNLQDCDYTIEVIRVGDILMANIGGCTTPLYTWYKDSGGGYELLGDTSDHITLSGNGLYKVVVDCSGCEKKAVKLILDNPECNMSVSINQSGNILIASISDAPCGSPQIRWFLNTGSQEVPIGQGILSINTTQNGLYRVEVTCGDCIKNATKLVYDCTECNLQATISQSGTGLPKTLTVNITGCTGSANIFWEYSDDGITWISSGNTISITAAVTGLYRVKVTCEDCEATDGVLICDEVPQNCFNSGSFNNNSVCN